MKQQEQRQIAIRAGRSQARLMGIDPAGIDAQGALAVLDDLARADRALLAAQWYRAASDNQVNLFIREWHTGGATK